MVKMAKVVKVGLAMWSSSEGQDQIIKDKLIKVKVKMVKVKW